MKPSSRGLWLATFLWLPAACVSRTAHMSVVNSNKGLAKTLAQYDRYLKELEGENAKLRAENARYRAAVKDASAVREQKKKLQELIDAFKKRGISGGLGEKVEFFETKSGDLGLRIQGKVLFQSGQAVITKEGRQTLSRIVDVLRANPGVIVVNGHTDADPIRHSKWKSNLHLSAARALAVAEFLAAKGISMDRLRIGGFGPNEPVSRTDKALNRRVEILVQTKR